MEHILPIGQRRPGLVHDMAVTSTLGRFALERLTMPTLVVTSEDDGYLTVDGARYTAAHVPGARLIVFPSGGHMLVGHQDELMAAIAKLRK